MKQIPLTQGKFALVDNEDYDILIQWNWYAVKKENTFYARSNPKQGITPIRMHRLIMGLNIGDERVIDHINHNGLDNQKHNLRICTQSENGRNRRPNKNKILPKGVIFVNKPKQKYYQAQIIVKSKFIYLGCFKHTPEGIIEAAKCYDEAAKKYHGEFANLNFKIKP